MIINPYAFGIGSGDPYFANVSSLLHFDGSDGSTTFTDQKGLSWTRPGGGNAELDTSSSKFGTASLQLTTGGISATAGAGSAFDLGTGDFTVEAWIKPNGLTTFQTIYSQREGGAGAAGLCFRVTNAGKLQAFYGAGTNQITGATTILTSAYQLATLCRVGAAWSIFLDGVQDATGAVSGNVSAGSQPSFIGTYGNFGLTTEQFVGRIDDFRITKGVGRYTSNFTPPTAAFPNI